MNSSDKNISKEQFHLIRKILQEKKEAGVQTNRPLKRKKRRLRSEIPNVETSTEPSIVINLEEEAPSATNFKNEPEVIDLENEEEQRININSDAKRKRCIAVKYKAGNTDKVPKSGDDYLNEFQEVGKENSETEHEDDEEEGFESEDFEDVPMVDNDVDDSRIQDVSVTFDSNNTQNSSKKKIVRNACSNVERIRRKEDHMIYLVMFSLAGFIRNQWINNSKLHKKLSKMISDEIFALLHPENDKELIIRSERKLLDGLKKCMEVYEKKWKILNAYDSTAFYMRFWNELPYESTQQLINKRNRLNTHNTLEEKSFIKQVNKGIGDRDIYVQGFVALLRSCQINARLVMSCQPPDFSNLKEKDNDTNPYILKDEVIKYPIFWCEVWNKFSKKWLSIDPINLKIIESVKANSKLEPKGVIQTKRNIMRYVLAFDRKLGCKDVTRRYIQWYNCKSRKKRINKDKEGQEWYNKLISALQKRKRMKIDDFEDEYFKERDINEGFPDTISELKNHPYYVLESDLRQNEILKPGSKECGYLRKNNKSKQTLRVYRRDDVLVLRSAKDWYMKGRILKAGCRALKRVKKRINSSNFDDDDDNIERLYPYEETELYIPPLAKADGEIKKNAYGNIEIFTSSMIPKNCVLIESPVAIKACKAIHIEFAPSVTGFKFEKGNKAKPILSGVVVANWFREAVECAIDSIEYSIVEEKRKERELAALKEWNSLFLKLRISSNLNSAYGKVKDENKKIRAISDENNSESDEDFSMGGFLPARKNDHTGYLNEGSQSDAQSDDDFPPQGYLPQRVHTKYNEEDDYVDEEEENYYEGEENDEMIANRNKLTASPSATEQMDEEFDDFMSEMNTEYTGI
ncbi:hypothetical protein TPHA_0B03450 [Tetrapisispora phaffii CBS 4417]|uniref:Rad4 beta-hairpin domain-containing protein n=1 Tax=Tetrapisispora phaffii (strain ATCC 24235 / CBS 4417 / NBRC 1672 / NRRL Y-8282 / UCD 70-5) TaxID=1071381 RepID=G8BPT4_TETPH|nr:hypothetical protein TPHA_0B03450 [Tetrapisispora phaffii CBS 4417]CCE62015.1 hypothetical protein TPHA_0B03450 [Tetrapisispora phaffii CBS 4417]